jgi:hypothetical protein
MLIVEQNENQLIIWRHNWQQAEMDENFKNLIITVDEMWVHWQDGKIIPMVSKIKTEQKECEDHA